MLFLNGIVLVLGDYMFNINIPFYGLAIILALISNIVVVFCLFKEYDYSIKEITCLLLYENVGIIGGAKILSYLLSYSKFKGNFNFINLGLTSYGAIFGSLLFIVLFCFQFKKSIKDTLFIFTPSIPLMYSIGKIGCFLAGCCYGVKYDGLFKIMYKYSNEAPNNVYLFPVQLIESTVFLIIFIYLIIQHKNNKFDSRTLSISIIACGLAKYILDFFRMNHTGFFSFNQIVSILFVIFGVFLYIIVKMKQNNTKGGDK